MVNDCTVHVWKKIMYMGNLILVPIFLFDKICKVKYNGLSFVVFFYDIYLIKGHFFSNNVLILNWSALILIPSLAFDAFTITFSGLCDEKTEQCDSCCATLLDQGTASTLELWVFKAIKFLKSQNTGNDEIQLVLVI